MPHSLMFACSPPSLWQGLMLCSTRMVYCCRPHVKTAGDLLRRRNCCSLDAAYIDSFMDDEKPASYKCMVQDKTGSYSEFELGTVGEEKNACCCG